MKKTQISRDSLRPGILLQNVRSGNVGRALPSPRNPKRLLGIISDCIAVKIMRDSNHVVRKEKWKLQNVSLYTDSEKKFSGH